MKVLLPMIRQTFPGQFSEVVANWAAGRSMPAVPAGGFDVSFAKVHGRSVIRCRLNAGT